MKKSYLSKGFTLIELLVVIAIIGILSSVVLASLSTARNRAQAVATTSSLKSLQPAIAICNSDLSPLLIVAGSPVCSTVTANLPTAAQLNSTSVTYTQVGSVGGQSYTALPTGHPVAACNTSPGYAISESSITPPTGCK